MYRSKILAILILIAGMALTGFECSSTEITSAKLYIQQKNYPRALEALQKEVSKNPKSDEGYYLMGYVNGELGNYSDMVSEFDSSLAISPQYQKSINDSKKYYWVQLFNQGVGYFQKGSNSKDKDSTKIDYDKSIEAFQNAIKCQPDSVDTYKNLAFVYMTEQKYDEAIAPLQTLLTKEKTIDGFKYLGEIYYDKAVKLKSKYETSHDVQDSVQSVEYYNKTINLLQEGRKYFPNDSDLLLMLSNSYIGANKIEVAMDAFKTGVEHEPTNKYYRYNYGVLLLGAKDYAKATEEFEKAVQIDPEYQNAVYNLAVTYVKWGAELAKASQEKSDSNANTVQDTSYLEKYRKAIPFLEKSVQMKPDDANTWELLGRVYTALGNQDKAKNAFDKADALRK